MRKFEAVILQRSFAGGQKTCERSTIATPTADSSTDIPECPDRRPRGPTLVTRLARGGNRRIVWSLRSECHRTPTVQGKSSENPRNFLYVRKISFTLRINRSLAAGSEGLGNGCGTGEESTEVIEYAFCQRYNRE